MNRDNEVSGRTLGDFILFGVTVLGFFWALSGTVVASLPAAVFGVILTLAGLTLFLLKRED
ncbi:MAG: hypothetical protein AB1813_01725 [Verrucomicrobiota bacterium]|jgi:hypothetical protein